MKGLSLFYKLLASAVALGVAVSAIAIVFLAVLVATAPFAAVAVAAGNKVVVCHRPPGNPHNYQTITISENALAAHLAHGDLAGACETQEPTIVPTSGIPMTPFTITDPLGRILIGDQVLFSNPAVSSSGYAAESVEISPDGTTLTADVPVVRGGEVYTVSVTPDPGSPPRFPNLSYVVNLYLIIEPLSGPAGTNITITDELLRQQPGDVVVFWVQGMNPCTPHVAYWADSTSVVGALLNSHAPPLTLGGLTYSVNVAPNGWSPDTCGPFRFPEPLTFTVA